MNTISCPKCGSPVEITEVLKKQIEGEVLAEEKIKHQKELEAARKEGDVKLTEELKLLKEEKEKQDEKLKEARENELELRKKTNEMLEEKKSWELQKQRELDKERETIRKKALEESFEEHRLKDAENEKKLQDVLKMNEDLKRKLEQGSQQTQGEVQELDLEKQFKEAFSGDLIEPIGKGVVGADIRQVVKSPRGIDCGSILWESKRTKAWSEGWITKLKEDTRVDKANIAAIVSDVLPEEIKSGIGLKDGVWICLPKLVVPLAMLLRKSLLDAAYQKAVSANRQTKAEEIYSYVTSHEFQQQVESLVEVYLQMQEQIIKEKVAFEKSWKQREAQVNRLLTGVGGIYGFMQGIAGPALPPIKNLELSSGD